MMWKQRMGNELYVFHNGRLVYKRWYKTTGEKKHASALFNPWGWRTVWILASDDLAK